MKIDKFKRKKRGSVLLLTFFILILLALLGTGFLFLIPVEMRNAQNDRNVVQSGYGADAGVRLAMNELQIGTPPANITTAPQYMGGGWQFKIDSVEALGNEEFKVTTSGILRGKTKRRAVAIIDDGSGEYAISFNSDAVDHTQNINNNGAWPISVPITGDVFVQGTWFVNNNGLNMSVPNADPPFKGTVFQSDPSGTALKGEKYVGTAPADASQYSTLYTNGMDAVQPFNTASLAAQDLFIQDTVRDNILGAVFGVDAASAVSTRSSASIVPGVNVPMNGANMAGGVYIEPASGSDFNIEFSVDANGNGVTLVTNGTKQYRMTFITEGGSYGGSTVLDTDDRLYVEELSGGGTTTTTGGGNGNGNGSGGNGSTTGGGSGGSGKGGGKNSSTGGTTTGTTTGGTTTTTGGGTTTTTGGGSSAGVFYNGDFSDGNVVYVNGSIASIQGTHKGNHTFAANDGITITGELLKSDTPRGEQPGPTSSDALGLVACVEAGNSSPGMSINMQGAVPSDNEYFVYAYVTALSKTDNNAKMFSQNQHPDLPNGTTLSLIGSMAWAPTTAGQINTAMRFIETWDEVILDKARPVWFPGKNSFVPRIRAYVDIPVAEY